MDERIARSALSGLVEPGNSELGAIVANCGAVVALQRLCAGRVSESLARQATKRLAGKNPASHGKELLERSHQLGIRLIIPTDAEWPSTVDDLVHLGDPDMWSPLGLWVRGSPAVNQLCQQAVAIVGARGCTSYGVHVARELGYGLAERGWTVISGAAYGIDGAAHRGALTAQGPTIAVLACGVDIAYPASHSELLASIAEQGLVISEWPPGERPAPHRFLTRNRVIAALAAGTVVVEAASRSGSKVTARRALELGRSIMAVPGPVTSACSEGTHELIREWRAELVTRPEEILELVSAYGS